MPAGPVPLIRRSLGRKGQYVIGQVPQPGLVRKREQWDQTPADTRFGSSNAAEVGPTVRERVASQRCLPG
jgi:hypothetical protein